jgi:hypothetical protein
MFATCLSICLLAAQAAAAPPGRAAKSQVPGEDNFRSYAGYTVAVMEHSKAVNKLARNAGSFNVELAKEHTVEIARNVASATRHFAAYQAALGVQQRAALSGQADEETQQAEVSRLAGSLSSLVAGPNPDRKAVATAATDLYLAARNCANAHKAAGKALGITQSPTPRHPAPRKPKTGTEVATKTK